MRSKNLGLIRCARLLSGFAMRLLTSDVSQGGNMYGTYDKRLSHRTCFGSAPLRGLIAVGFSMLTLINGVGAQEQNSFRFPLGAYSDPPGPTNAAVCASQPYWPTAAQACQAMKTYHPACDRISAVYRGHVATLVSPSRCQLTWQYQNIGDPNWYGYSTTADLEPVCPVGTKRVDQVNGCVPIVEDDKTGTRPEAGDACYGNPVYPLRGAKRERLETGLALGGQALVFTYDSTASVPVAALVTGASVPVRSNAFGANWSGSFHRTLRIEHGLRGARVTRGDGRLVSFLGNGAGSFTATSNTNDRLEYSSGAYRYYDQASGSIETYSADGTLLQINSRSGGSLGFFYSTGASQAAPRAGLLLSVLDTYGRRIEFRYDGQSRVVEVLDPTGRPMNLAYSGGALQSVTWQDGAVITLLYEDARFAWALTGVVAEDERRRSYFGYDAAGRASSTTQGAGVNSFSVAYSAPPVVLVSDVYDPQAGVVRRTRIWQMPEVPVVTTPLGNSITLAVASAAGVPVVASRSQPAGSGCEASVSTQAFDTRGNLSSRTDFNGNRTCYAHDSARNLEVARVEGLQSTAACGVTEPGASLPAGTRKVSTAWHPDWAIPTRVAEPLRQTFFVYNGQPDPFSNNAVANCVNEPTVLPDGKPLVVLCKKVELATTDATGALGFAAGAAPNVSLRVDSWMYDAFGKVRSHDGPRTDVSDVTQYEYYASTTFTTADPEEAGVRAGDLWKVVDPVGLTVENLSYNKAGNPLVTRDQSGVTRVQGYDARQRPVSTAVGDRTLRWEYWPTGLLRRMIRPDGSWIRFTFDSAQRLSSVTDSVGNSVSYTLDPLGNRVGEQHLDPSGTLRREIQRVIDALGRVEQVTGE